VQEPNDTMATEHATETSPLLKPPRSDHHSSGSDAQANYEAANGPVVDNGDEEVQQQDDRNYEGLPEVQARLKYIIPAVAIGVGFINTNV
jgi:hypothetical protein